MDHVQENVDAKRCDTLVFKYIYKTGFDTFVQSDSTRISSGNNSSNFVIHFKKQTMKTNQTSLHSKTLYRPSIRKSVF